MMLELIREVESLRTPRTANAEAGAMDKLKLKRQCERARTTTLPKWWRSLNSGKWPKELGEFKPLGEWTVMCIIAQVFGERVIIKTPMLEVPRG